MPIREIKLIPPDTVRRVDGAATRHDHAIKKVIVLEVRVEDNSGRGANDRIHAGVLFCNSRRDIAVPQAKRHSTCGGHNFQGSKRPSVAK